VYFYSAINNCSHCAVVSSKPVSFQQAPEAPKTEFFVSQFFRVPVVAYWTIRRQTNSQSVKSRTDQLADCNFLNHEKNSKDYTFVHQT